MNNTVGKRFTEVETPDWFDASLQTRLSLPDILGANDDFAGRIRDQHILFVGGGAVGAPVITTLAQLGVKALTVSDLKRYRNESMYSQLTDREGIGQFKAEYRARLAKAISPATRVRYANCRIQDIDIAEFKDVTLVVLTSDNVNAEIYTFQLALWLRLPVVQGAVHAQTTLSHVKTFANRNQNDPCGACWLNEMEWTQAAEEVEYTCDPGSGETVAPNILTIPTNCLPNTSANCASTVATQIQKLIGGFGTPVENTMHEFCGHTGVASVWPIERNEHCRLDHGSSYEFHDVEGIGSATIADLASGAGIAGDVPFLVTVGDYDWSDPPVCANGHTREAGDFLPIDRPAQPRNCETCGAPVIQSPFSRRDSVALRSLGSSVDKPLSDLGVNDAAWVKIQAGDRTVIITPATQTLN